MRTLGWIAAIGSLLLTSGCATRPYPDHWPAPAAATGMECQDVSGSYANFGAWDDGDRSVLASVFFPLKPSDSTMLNYELLAVSHITLALQASGVYVVDAMVGDEPLLRRETTAEELECSDHRLILHSTGWSLGGVPPFLPVVTHDSIDQILSLAADGSLVVENEVFSAGAALIVPLAVRSRHWYLFAPAEPALNENPNRPRGIRVAPAGSQRLLPPDTAADWSGYDLAGQCIDAAGDQSWSPAPGLSQALGGRATQAFLLQDGKGGAVVQSGRVADKNWHPADHALRVEKQHWLPPEFTGRYVMCLLDRGYRWAEPD